MSTSGLYNLVDTWKSKKPLTTVELVPSFNEYPCSRGFQPIDTDQTSSLTVCGRYSTLSYLDLRASFNHDSLLCVSPTKICTKNSSLCPLKSTKNCPYKDFNLDLEAPVTNLALIKQESCASRQDMSCMVTSTLFNSQKTE